MKNVNISDSRERSNDVANLSEELPVRGVVRKGGLSKTLQTTFQHAYPHSFWIGSKT